MAITRFSAVKPHSNRTTDRYEVALPARLTWKDASGAIRFISVTTRDVSAAGAYVEADATTAIPLHRLVHVQLERTARDMADVPQALRDGRVPAAIWRVEPCRPTRGTPGGYALRFLVDPASAAPARRATSQMAVAS